MLYDFKITHIIQLGICLEYIINLSSQKESYLIFPKCFESLDRYCSILNHAWYKKNEIFSLDGHHFCKYVLVQISYHYKNENNASETA